MSYNITIPDNDLGFALRETPPETRSQHLLGRITEGGALDQELKGLDQKVSHAIRELGDCEVTSIGDVKLTELSYTAANEAILNKKKRPITIVLKPSTIERWLENEIRRVSRRMTILKKDVMYYRDFSFVERNESNSRLTGLLNWSLGFEETYKENIEITTANLDTLARNNHILRSELDCLRKEHLKLGAQRMNDIERQEKNEQKTNALIVCVMCVGIYRMFGLITSLRK